VTFDIDANGILNVSAKDKATNKEQSIVIKASSGLSEAEIEKMVRDAEAHAEEDKKLRELVDARNQADSLIHSVNKSVKELGDDKVTAEEKAAVEAAVKALEEAMKGDDKDSITAKTEELAKVSHGIAEKAYAETNAGAAGGQAHDANTSKPNKGGDDDIVDAEFEEVKK
jgi:molecular chaperone DnaK